MKQNTEKISRAEKHEKILATLRKEFDYDTGISGRNSYRKICKELNEIDNPPKDGPRWSQSQQRREQLLEEKARYENTPELMNYPSSFAEQVHIAIENIVKHKLNKNIPNLTQNITRAMRRWGLDAKWISEKTGLKSSQIHAYLNTKEPKTSISPFYLELFCLISLADPYDLLDLRLLYASSDYSDLHIPSFNPLIPTKDQEAVYRYFILNRFLDPHDKDKLLRLQTITKIAKLKAEKYHVFQYIVKQIPTLSKAISTPLPDISMLSLDEQHTQYLSDASYKYSLSDGSDKTQPYYIIAEVDHFLQFLTRFDLDRMKVLARFANANDTVWRILIAILIDGGFPPKNISLHDKLENNMA